MVESPKSAQPGSHITTDAGDFSGRVPPIDNDLTTSNQSEKMQTSFPLRVPAIYLISHAAYSADKLDDLYFQIHTILGDLMPVENFFIAIYDSDEGMLSFPILWMTLMKNLPHANWDAVSPSISCAPGARC